MNSGVSASAPGGFRRLIDVLARSDAKAPDPASRRPNPSSPGRPGEEDRPAPSAAPRFGSRPPLPSSFPRRPGISLLLLLLLILSSCGPSEGQLSSSEAAQREKDRVLGNLSSDPPVSASDADQIRIEGESFPDQIQRILAYPEAHVGKRIRFEGFYCLEEGPQGETVGFIYRMGDDGHDHGDGQAHEDARLGFELIGGSRDLQEGDWVSLEGTLDYVHHRGIKYLGIRPQTLTVADPPQTPSAD